MGKKKSLIVYNILPVSVLSLVINFKAIIDHLVIYFMPRNRWKRYDNPKTELSYRMIAQKQIEVVES